MDKAHLFKSIVADVAKVAEVHVIVDEGIFLSLLICSLPFSFLQLYLTCMFFIVVKGIVGPEGAPVFVGSA